MQGPNRGLAPLGDPKPVEPGHEARGPGEDRYAVVSVEGAGERDRTDWEF